MARALCARHTAAFCIAYSPNTNLRHVLEQVLKVLRHDPPAHCLLHCSMLQSMLCRLSTSSC